MKNYVQDGKTVTITAMPEAVDSGEFIKVGALYGVAPAAYDNGAEGVLVRSGVFELPKATGAWSQGDALYWDASAKNFTKTVGSNSQIGVAFLAAESGDTTGLVALGASAEAAGGADVAGVAAGYKIARGQHTTIDADDTVVTGLATVVAAVATFESDPVAGAQTVTAVLGDQAGAPAAGSIQIKTWKATATADTAVIPATTFSKLVNWIAIGT